MNINGFVERVRSAAGEAAHEGEDVEVLGPRTPAGMSCVEMGVIFRNDRGVVEEMLCRGGSVENVATWLMAGVRARIRQTPG